MPTGYTSIIEDGDGCSFEQYVWRCARAFGALIDMRDDSLDKRVPAAPLEPDTKRYDADIRAGESKLRELRGMTIEQGDAMAAAEYDQLCAYHGRDTTEKDARDARYKAVRDRVFAWQPPGADHDRLKSFMLEQIDMCYPAYRSEPPRKRDGAEWLRASIESAERRLGQDREYRDNEIKRTAERNAWVATLRGSVPQP